MNVVVTGRLAEEVKKIAGTKSLICVICVPEVVLRIEGGFHVSPRVGVSECGNDELPPTRIYN